MREQEESRKRVQFRYARRDNEWEDLEREPLDWK